MCCKGLETIKYIRERSDFLNLVFSFRVLDEFFHIPQTNPFFTTKKA